MYMDIQFFLLHLLKTLSFLKQVFSALLLNTGCPYIHGFISAFLILFHWSSWFFIFQYHIVLITIVLYYSLESSAGCAPLRERLLARLPGQVGLQLYPSVGWGWRPCSMIERGHCPGSLVSWGNRVWSAIGHSHWLVSVSE